MTADLQDPRIRARAAIAHRHRTRANTPLEPTYLDWYRTTIPEGYTVPAHIEYLCEQVQRLIDGKVQRIAISTPPGHGKSETITRRLPNYWARKYVGDVIVQTGYSQRFAEKNLSLQTREIAREAGTLSASATALDEWEWSNGSRLVTRGVGSAPTGVNPISLLVCDDPINSREDARSKTKRDNVWQWWTGSIVQRFWPRTRALVIATRWHEDDLIGKLKASEDALPEEERTWEFVNLPALCDDEETDPLGRQLGEALWPEAKPAAFLHALKREMGSFEFDALFQGKPTPREGSMFKVAKIRHIDPDQLPTRVLACRAWDLAATDGGGDYTAGVLMSRGTDGLFYVEDVVRGQWDSAERNRRMRQTAERDGRDVKIRIPQDPGQAGKDQARLMVQMLAGYSVEVTPVSGSKETRADPLASQVNHGLPEEAGNVRLVRGTWNSEFIDEMRAFPAGTHDDMVDGSADAFAAVTYKPLDLRVF